MKATMLGAWLDELFPKGPLSCQLERRRNIWYRCVLSWIPPRDPRWEYELEMGSPMIPNVFSGEPLSPRKTVVGGQHLYFCFPERHMSTQEEHGFIYALENHSDVTSRTMSVIDIVTKSPLIIGSFHKEDIRILKAAK